MNVSQRLNDYSKLYSEMEVTPTILPKAKVIADKIKENESRYQEISNALGGLIPYYFIGIIHNMECGLDFGQHLHNGDSLKRRTVQVPQGRPIDPPKSSSGYSFLESAIDALKMKGYDKKESWELPEILYRLEAYNGWGYYYKDINSPYLWAGTNLYTKGKYVSDGVFDENAVSKQIGSAVIISLLT
jgi:lysozyme family protein